MEQGTVLHYRYKLKNTIGRGAFAEVWLAEDNYTKTLVALKIFAPTQNIGDYGNRLLSSEFSVVANLRHKNLLCPLHYDICDGKPYLVLPYCEHGSCVKLIGKMSEYEAWNLMRDVASGLSYLHSHKPKPIIHQDVKPDNILIGSKGQYMLSDFGVSDQTLLTANNTDGNQVDINAGMCGYKGPEFFSKEKVSIKASDIYSLGVTMYELLTGDLPFGEMGGLVQMHGCETPKLPDRYSEKLNYVVSACLNKDPWLRPTAETLEKWAMTKGTDIPQFARKQEDRVQDDYKWNEESNNHYDPYYNTPENYNSKPKRRKVLLAVITTGTLIIASVVILLLAKCEKPYNPFPANYSHQDTCETETIDAVAKKTNNRKKHLNENKDTGYGMSNDFEYSSSKDKPLNTKASNNEVKKSIIISQFENGESEAKNPRDSVIKSSN